MSRCRAVVAGAAAAALGLAAAGCGADVEPGATTTTATGTATAARATTARAPAGQAPAATAATAGRSSGAPARLQEPLAFHVRRRTQLREQPGGKVVTTIRPRTEFRSPQILAVAGRKPGWVLVRTSVRGHHVGWLPTRSGALFSEPRTIVVDLSRRTLSVFHRGRLTDVYRVAVGARGTETPTGTFGVTDRLTLRPGTPYGCCVLALTARQPKIPQGWGGGDRVAIHATPDEAAVGKAVSHGCLRASDRTLRRLMARIRLGTPVTIHQ
jgi:lipoprotein-anchoring transpeptidase ErfK/SrfK